MRKLFTSESVTEGHPDKLCDQVSDAVLDALLAQDCETCATTGMVMVMGEITTTAKVDIPAIVRDVVLDIGYNDSSLCFDGNTCAVLTSIHAQSPDIAMGVDDALETRTQDANEIGGRSGHDVRLRVRRDAGIHAHGDCLRAPPDPPPD